MYEISPVLATGSELKVCHVHGKLRQIASEQKGYGFKPEEEVRSMNLTGAEKQVCKNKAMTQIWPESGEGTPVPGALDSGCRD